MTTARFLIDTSAVVRLLRNRAVRERWQSQITAGVIGMCPLTELELLYTARSKADREELVGLLDAAFTWVGIPDRGYAQASRTQQHLTDDGTHRSAGTVDLLVAATAHLEGLTLVHYDHDFEAIARVTGQPTVWLAPPGSIP
ncbi:PIN domain nuclease [Catenuloplanes atrovinosus]|uniref:Ribonuclease VapC n=1 Tax=Catenuloplanes atrovinosus TaxID=137266 RepID=A0AAE4CBF3_9ACTN|nr:PIN domain nuclease [Catenuloplanes atrovinosus]MDR7278023.1 putative nucleic acid-binding protein [Catenuloplanes atrovinosus]